MKNVVCDDRASSNTQIISFIRLDWRDTMAQQILSKKDCQPLKMIGRNIAYYRKKLGLSQEKMAERADISRVHLGRIEQGVGVASLPVLFSISDVLGIPLESLFEFPVED